MSKHKPTSPWHDDSVDGDLMHLMHAWPDDGAMHFNLKKVEISGVALHSLKTHLSKDGLFLLHIWNLTQDI